MKFVLLISCFTFVVSNSICPDGCQCQDNRLQCHSLSSIELSHLMAALSTPSYSNIESLHILSTSNFSINQLPSLKLLRALSIEDCPNTEEWQIARNKFPNVTQLTVVNSNLTVFSRYLMSAFPQLQVLDLSNNELTTLGFDSIHLAKLEKLVLAHNNIESLGVHILRYMPMLRELDLSHNKLFRLVTSDFYSAISLRILKLSFNLIRVIECDTSTQLPQIEQLDLSSNKLTEIPGDGIRNMEQISYLNISRNPINIVAEASLRFQNLQILDISHCNLKVVEAGAFSYLPYLHTLYLNDNPNLVFISPFSVKNISAIFSLDLQNTGFYRIPTSITSQISRIYINNVRLDCACVLKYMSDIESMTVMDWSQATCATKTGAVHKLRELSESMISPSDECRDRLVLPFGDEQQAMIGDSYRIHCSNFNQNSKMYWKSPGGNIEPAVYPEIGDRTKKLDYFTTSLFDPIGSLRRENRTHLTTDYYGIDVVLEKDNGVYDCISKNGQTISRKIKLKTIMPDIKLNASHIGVTSVHLTWNKNLHIRAVDRVALQVIAESGSEFKRQVQLSLYNMYCSYNLINLTPNKEYHICLRWIIIDDNSVIYSSCLTEKTKPVKTFLDSVSVEFIVIGGLVIFAFVCFCCGNCLHQRFGFLAAAKRDSKMQQSVSGQSMLSHSIASSTDATTYENFQLHTSPSFHNPMA